MEHLNECKLPNEVKNFWLSICSEIEERIYCEVKGCIIGEEIVIKIKLKKINYNCGMNFRLNDMKKEFIIDSIINCLRYDLYTNIFKER